MTIKLRENLKEIQDSLSDSSAFKIKLAIREINILEADRKSLCDMVARLQKRNAKLLEERDELKSKLADSELEASNLDGALRDAVHDLEMMKSKLAEIEAQEPLKFAWKHDYGFISNVVFDHWDDANDSWKGKAEGKVVSLYAQPKPSQPIANNSERITEQDAIEIIDKYKHWELHVSFRDSSEEQFFKEKEGIDILTKLNEHREPVQASDPVDYSELIRELKVLAYTLGAASDDEHSYDFELLNRAIEAINSQVTPNKAEVDNDLSKLYYEAHITIEPVFDERREEAGYVALAYGFKLADLLMKKRKEDTEERSSKDTFMTGHSKSFKDLEQRTKECIIELQEAGFKVWRYKIEDTILDSRTEDVFNLIGD